MRMRESISSTIAAGVSCNWPYTLEDAIETDLDIGHRKLTRVFEEYVSDFNHWTVGRRFLDTFPELEGRIKIKEPLDNGPLSWSHSLRTVFSVISFFFNIRRDRCRQIVPIFRGLTS